MLGNGCKVTAYRKRHLDFSVYFDVAQDLCYCKDVNGLFNAIGIEHEPTQWRILLTVPPKALKQFYFIMGTNIRQFLSFIQYK